MDGCEPNEPTDAAASVNEGEEEEAVETGFFFPFETDFLCFK